ncbi:hypothetical protein DFH29DRAFT_377628 [Suillus ampliporus]|nr:hypothetical protein DFH29DRAFT_377628 [Suillus ampliporus]
MALVISRLCPSWPYLPPVVGLRKPFVVGLHDCSLCYPIFPGIMAFRKPGPTTSPSSLTDCRMCHNFWQRNSELYKHVEASQAERLQGTTHDGQPTSQLPQNYPPSAPVNSYEDPTRADTQHQAIYGGDPTISDQMLAPTDLHDAGLFQSDISGLSLSDILVPLPCLDREIGHRDIHSAAGPPSHKISYNYFHHVVSDYPSASPPSSVTPHYVHPNHPSSGRGSLSPWTSSR